MMRGFQCIERLNEKVVLGKGISKLKIINIINIFKKD
jgi:hypothetical protein